MRALQMMLDPNLSTLIITQQQQQRYSYISLAQIDRQVTSDNAGIYTNNTLHYTAKLDRCSSIEYCAPPQSRISRGIKTESFPSDLLSVPSSIFLGRRVQGLSSLFTTHCL